MRSCNECFNFVARIPIIGDFPLNARLDFDHAVGRCKHGLLTMGKRGDIERVFPGILKKGQKHDLKCLKVAEGCHKFEGEE